MRAIAATALDHPSALTEGQPKMTVQTEPAAAIEAVRLVRCEHCRKSRPGRPCTSAGDHFARWARARRKGLITAEQLGAALDLLTVITNAAIVPDVTP
jgi:hypothetical protein